MSMAAFGYVMEAIFIAAGLIILGSFILDVIRNGWLGDKRRIMITAIDHGWYIEQVFIERHSATECLELDEFPADRFEYERKLADGSMTIDAVAQAMLAEILERESLDETLADEDRTREVSVSVTITMTGEAKVAR